MRNLLPDIGPDGGYATLPSEALEAWMAGVKEIVGRHGIRVTSVSRFARGENPVFEINDRLVVKLLPRRSAHIALREVDCLGWLSQCKTVPLPKLVGSGQLEEWSYLISTKLPGLPLSERWAELGGANQEAVALELGQMLSKLHDIPLGGFSPGGVQWQDFLVQRTTAWFGRSSVARLPPRLRDSGPEYIAQAQLGRIDSRTVFLHGDLAPENCLVSQEGGTCRITGVLDFGNAMAGHALFDFTALTVLLAPGNAKIIHEFFKGYGLGRGVAAGLQRQLMAYTLLHPLGDLSQILGLMPGLDRYGTWDEVAERFWPAAAMP
jgi:hygromycin-B 7''-O-kinase